MSEEAIAGTPKKHREERSEGVLTGTDMLALRKIIRFEVREVLGDLVIPFLYPEGRPTNLQAMIREEFQRALREEEA